MEFTTWAKYINSRYYSDIHGCINTSTSMSKYKNFQILLDSSHREWLEHAVGRKLKYYWIVDLVPQS